MTNSKHILGIGLMSLVIFSACKKDGLKLAETINPGQNAFMKVMYYSPSPNANFILKFDTTKVATTFFYSQVNPSDGTAYLSVPSGSGSGRFVLPKVGTKEDSVIISNFNYATEAGKYYSVFVIDTGSKVKALIVPDSLDLPAEDMAKVRFVNTMYNVPAMDIKLTNGTVLASGLAFGSATNFIDLPAAQLHGIRFYNPGTSVQLTGTNSGTFKLDLTPTNRRIYTIALRGIAGSTATVPVVSIITNR
jgi:hypothetical protein